MTRRVGWFCLWTEIDGSGFEIEDLRGRNGGIIPKMRRLRGIGKMFLRARFTAKVIPRRTTLTDNVSISHEDRMKCFHDIGEVPRGVIYRFQG